MKLLIEVRKEDTVDNEFIDCNDCAISRAVKRVIKDNVFVHEQIKYIQLSFNDANSVFRVLHESFGYSNFVALQRSPDGTIHILEMDIPEQFLKSACLNPINKPLEVKQCA